MFQFPLNPAVGQTFTPTAGVTFRWNGTAWFLLAGPGAFISQAEGDLRYLQLASMQSIGNRIINGKFAISQRFASGVTNVSVGGVYWADRWYASATGGGVLQMFDQPDPTFPGEFRGVAAVQTADAALAAADLYTFGQIIEGRRVADLNFGSANAKAVTLAFEIQPGVIGLHAVAFRNAALDRSYVATFNCPAIARQEVVITIPGDTAGAWLKDSGIGMTVSWVMGAGATANAPAANAWQAGNFQSVAGVVNEMATALTAVLLRNVRLYPGSVDFGPDRRLYAEELALAMRYYQKSYDVDVVPGTVTPAGQRITRSVSAAQGVIDALAERVSPPMRAVPAVVWYSPATGGINTVRDEAAAADRAVAATLNPAQQATGYPSLTVPITAAGGFVSAHFVLNAEL